MEGRQHRAGLSSYAHREKVRLGFRQLSTGHLVCLVQACVKGLYLYLYLYLRKLQGGMLHARVEQIVTLH